MKIVLDLEEVKKIVAAHLIAKGFRVSAANGDFTKVTEGLYDESREVVTGISFDVMEGEK